MDHVNGDVAAIVNIQQARQITEAVQAINPEHAFFWYGGSGVGKSAVAEQMVKPGEGFFPVYAHAFNHTESNGIPYVNEKTGLVEFAKLGILPLPEERGDPESGIICIEEVTQAPPSIQAELMKLIYARVSGMYKIPPKYRVIGTSNRPKDKAGVNPSPYPLRIRWTWLEIEADLDTWVANFAIPHDIDHTIIAFLRFKPTSFVTDPPPADGPGAAPRTWDMLNDVLVSGLPDMVDLRSGKPELLRAAALGTVGASAGTEYMKYREVYKLLPPDMHKVALGEDPWRPDRDDLGLIYATTYSLVHIFRKEKSKHDRGKIANTVASFGDYLTKEQFLPLLRDCWQIDRDPFRALVKDDGTSRWREIAEEFQKYVT